MILLKHQPEGEQLNFKGMIHVNHSRAAAPAPFQALKRHRYNLIMADPPWPTLMRSPAGYGKSFHKYYRPMSWVELLELQVGALAADDCALFMWVTWPLLLHGGNARSHFAGADASSSRVGAVMHAWGFRFVTGGAWIKRMSRGGLAFGCGYRVRDACEPFLIGIRGTPKTTRSERNLIDGLRREHSRKPEEAYTWCERWLPGAKRLELFSRTNRRGWTTWGDQAGLFG